METMDAAENIIAVTINPGTIFAKAIIDITNYKEDYLMKFFICEHCGNIIEYVKSTGVPVMCCGQKMTELIPGTSDGAHEKHVPVVTINGDTVVVEVGSVEHPMVEAHYIQWIAIETTHGSQRIYLTPDDKPRAEFKLADGEAFVAAYEYCNLHGLWKSN